MKRVRPPLFLLVVVSAILLAFLQVGILSFAFDKLGLTPESSTLLLATMLFGSFVNVPIFTLRVDFRRQEEILRQVFHLPGEARNFLMPKRVVVAVNIGGCLMPVCFSLYLLLHNPQSTLLRIYCPCLIFNTFIKLRAQRNYCAFRQLK